MDVRTLRRKTSRFKSWRFRNFRAAFARPLLPDREAFRAPAQLPRQRLRAWFDFLFVDFALLRLFWKNRAPIIARGTAPRGAWRMNQPFPADIAWAARRGIRTIVTARHDPRHGGNALVAEACRRLGLGYATFPLFSRTAPWREALLSAPAFFARLDHPILIHCKSGADRAGFLAALYLIVVEKASVREARKQLSLRFLHLKASRAGILDAVFDAYLAAHPAEDVAFLDWVARGYDDKALMARFRSGTIADFVDQVLLRHE